MSDAGTVATTAAWINTVEYKELNFARKALVINPTKASHIGLSFRAPTAILLPRSPLGGVLARDGGDSPGRAEVCQGIGLEEQFDSRLKSHDATNRAARRQTRPM